MLFKLISIISFLYILGLWLSILDEKKYPNLKIVYQETLGNYLKYLLSGGLNFKQILPDFFTRPIEIAQKLISPFNKWIALHHVIVIKKIH